MGEGGVHPVSTLHCSTRHWLISCLLIVMEEVTRQWLWCPLVSQTMRKRTQWIEPYVCLKSQWFWDLQYKKAVLGTLCHPSLSLSYLSSVVSLGPRVIAGLALPTLLGEAHA